METRRDQRKSRHFRRGLKQKSAIILFCLALTFSPYSIVAEGDDDREPDDQTTEEVAEGSDDQDEANDLEENTTEDESNREEESDDSDAVAEAEDEGNVEESSNNESEATEEESNESDDSNKEEEKDADSGNESETSEINTAESENANKEDYEKATEASDQEADSSEESTEEEDDVKEEKSEGTEKEAREEDSGEDASEETATEEETITEIVLMAEGDFDDIFVPYGTSREELDLPEEIVVEYSPFSLPNTSDIDWDDGDPEYDGHSPGRYHFTGETSAFTGPEQEPVVPTITVEVEGLEVTSVESLETIEVPFGTGRGDLELPDEVEVALSDGSDMDLGITWAESDPGFDGTAPGVYTFRGDLSLSGPAVNPDNLQASVDVDVQNPTVQAVENVDFIELPVGIEWEDLPLPDEVGVQLEDDSWQDVPVNWVDGTNGSEYDPYEIDTYSLIGELQLPKGIENPDELSASVTVYVEMTEIVDVETFETDMEVMFGTAKEDLPLPDEVEVTLDNDYTIDLPVNWGEGDPEYDSESPGTVTFTGTFDVPEEIVRPGAEYGMLLLQSLNPDEHILNPDGLTASITIEVQAPYITDVSELDPVIVPYGTQAEDVPVPEEVEVTLNTGDTMDLEVIWLSANPSYNPYMPGTYNLTGALNIGVEILSIESSSLSAAEFDANDIDPSMIENPDELPAMVDIIVEAPYITDVEDLKPIEVPYGTERGDFEVPSEVEVTISNGSKAELPVTWVESNPDYNSNMPGAYMFTGEFNVPGEWEDDEIRPGNGDVRPAMIEEESNILEVLTNPEGLSAMQPVFVLPPYLTDVEELDPIEVPYGTEEEDLPVPDEVEVTLSDGSTTHLPVTWEGSDPDYDGQTPGEYDFTGTFAIPEEWEDTLDEGDVRLAQVQSDVDIVDVAINPEGLTASVTVHVLDPLPVAVEEFDAIEVPHGTEEEDLELPEEAMITYEDDSEQAYAVEWVSSDPDYDGDSEGTYTFTGMLQDRETDEFSEVTIDVIVLPAEKEEEMTEEKEPEEALPQTNQNMNMSLYLAGALFILLAAGLAVRNRRTGTANE
ncbi:Ig-like domain-containing protein [Salisediminibacterium beveridgei]|uniref:S-Layer Domain-Containing Protein n=1 Tax=Salisediminibacterium beveridgei TaxID=632773 RepID=A0A1D7QRU5_9BACI|nr:Ig-like domain-containing protein [Salisediminibacterium beveridgei]AOM81737.1 S-Layer Domain-Containing Protein [Salisediminibacterium beveridgei]